MSTAKPYTLTLDASPPNFRLKGTDGNYYALNHFANAEVLIIFFTCNHCPYVKASDEVTRHTAEKYQKKNVVFVGINSNNDIAYPEDSYENMVKRMQEHHFPWIYLRDETQEVAHDYGALRTPHFFVFNKKRQLIYTGRAIDSPRDPSKMTTNDLENALEDYFEGRPIKTPLTNPMGCTIKWIGKDKHWMPDSACDLV
jgi:peroxiredoxin